MEKLQYFTHHILQSKYRLIINIFLFSLIYFAFYADSYYTFCMKHAGTSESKDDIIRELRRQVLALRTEKDFLTNNLNHTTKEMFDYKHEHLNELKQLRDENQKLQLQQLQQTVLESPSETKTDVEPKLTRGARRKLKLMAKAAETKATSVLPIAEATVEAESLETFNAPLREANRKLQQDYGNLLREMQARTLRPVCEDKQIQTNLEDILVEMNSNSIDLNLNSHDREYLNKIFLNENVNEKVKILKQKIEELEQNTIYQLENRTHSVYNERNGYLTVQRNGILTPNASNYVQTLLTNSKILCIKDFIMQQFNDNPKYLLKTNIHDHQEIILQNNTQFIYDLLERAQILPTTTPETKELIDIPKQTEIPARRNNYEQNFWWKGWFS